MVSMGRGKKFEVVLSTFADLSSSALIFLHSIRYPGIEGLSDGSVLLMGGFINGGE